MNNIIHLPRDYALLPLPSERITTPYFERPVGNQRIALDTSLRLTMDEIDRVRNMVVSAPGAELSMKEYPYARLFDREQRLHAMNVSRKPSLPPTIEASEIALLPYGKRARDVVALTLALANHQRERGAINPYHVSMKSLNEWSRMLNPERSSQPSSKELYEVEAMMIRVAHMSVLYGTIKGDSMNIKPISFTSSCDYHTSALREFLGYTLSEGFVDLSVRAFARVHLRVLLSLTESDQMDWYGIFANAQSYVQSGKIPYWREKVSVLFARTRPHAEGYADRAKKSRYRQALTTFLGRLNTVLPPEWRINATIEEGADDYQVVIRPKKQTPSADQSAAEGGVAPCLSGNPAPEAPVGTKPSWAYGVTSCREEDDWASELATYQTPQQKSRADDGFVFSMVRHASHMTQYHTSTIPRLRAILERAVESTGLTTALAERILRGIEASTDKQS